MHVTQKELYLNDFSMAERFANKYKQNVFFIQESDEWVVWDGQRFRYNKLLLEQFVKNIIEELYIEAENEQSKGNLNRADLLKEYANDCSSYGAIKRILMAARSIPELIASQGEFDTHDNLINTEAGIIELKTGELKPHDPKYKITQMANVGNNTYQLNVESEVWQKFLDDITNGDKKLQEYLQIAIGYALTGYTIEQLCFICLGNGSNGKSTFFYIIKYILGDYAKVTPTKTLLATGYNGINADEARLAGSRFVIATEVNGHQKFDEAKLKSLTGEDTITARELRKNFFEFRPKCKIFMAVNDLPRISSDEAAFRRIRVIPFIAKFSGDHLDKDIAEKLMNEIMAIFAWAVRGAVKWSKNGFPDCNAVTEATSLYKQEADIIKEFLEDKITLKDGANILIAELYEEYCKWSVENNDVTLSKNKFGAFLKKKGFEQRKSGSKRYWVGLDLKTRA